MADSKIILDTDPEAATYRAAIVDQDGKTIAVVLATACTQKLAGEYDLLTPAQLRADRDAVLEYAAQICERRVTYESGMQREDYENLQCAAAIRSAKGKQG